MSALGPGLLLVVLAALLVGIRRPAHATVTVHGSEVHVRLGAWDKLLCLRGDLRLPLSQVAGVAAAPRPQVPATGLRLPGTSVPGVIRAGSYGTGAARDFWDVRRGETLLVLQLRPGAPYRRVVLEVPDPAALAQQLTPALGSCLATRAASRRAGQST